MDPETLAFIASIASSGLNAYNSSQNRDQQAMTAEQLAEQKRQFDLQEARRARMEPVDFATNVDALRKTATKPSSYDFLSSLAGRY